MEALNVLTQTPMPIVIIAIVILLAITLVIAYQYAKMKGLNGIREDVYQLILRAEHMYYSSGSGKQKMHYVVNRARSMLPGWLRLFLTEETMEKIIDEWFKGVKDLLDDGKVNGSQVNSSKK